MKKLIALLILFVTFLAFADEPWVDYLPEPHTEFNPKSYECIKTEQALIIDGKMDDEAWKRAVWTDLFMDIEGDPKPKPYLKTRMKMLWDNEYLYFGCEMEEPHIWAKLKERDSVIFFDNDFEIFIDPDGDTHNYYEFEMNAFNTVWDLFLSKPYRDSGCKVLDSWDIQGLKTAVDIQGTLNDATDEDEGWSVEVAIPWKVLEECANGTPPKQDDVWRVNFSRVQWETEVVEGEYIKQKVPEHNWVWSPQGIINMHYPERWGFVRFSEMPAGSKQEKYVINDKDIAKDVLRQIFYKQRTFYYKNAKFAKSLEELNFQIPNEEDFLPVEIYVTPSRFEIILSSKDNKFRLHISEDGKTWETK
jgi:hypothetical protein